MTATHDAAWFGEQVGKSADWVSRHLDEIPHSTVGRSARFTERDLADYLDSTRSVPMRMVTTGRRRSV
jgi:hypothetical protein